jgi:hypothetical protein
MHCGSRLTQWRWVSREAPALDSATAHASQGAPLGRRRTALLPGRGQLLKGGAPGTVHLRGAKKKIPTA